MPGDSERKIMITAGEIGFDVKFSAVMGFIAMILSFFTGIIAGNSPGQVLLRTAVLTIVFLAIGYLAMFIIRRYVPEIYEYLSSSLPGNRDRMSGDLKDIPGSISLETPGEEIEGSAAANEGSGTGIKKPEKLDEEELSGGFVPFKDNTFDTYSTVKPGKADLGKHLLEEKRIKYEPKIMAEAIRTMMSRDKE